MGLILSLIFWSISSMGVGSVVGVGEVEGLKVKKLEKLLHLRVSGWSVRKISS
jgi:hypothetical protein